MQLRQLPLGLRFGIPVQEMLDGLASVSLPGGRMRRVQAASGFEIIDDAYNANPGSVSALSQPFQVLLGIELGVVSWEICLSLGDKAKTYHREIGRIAGGSGAVEVWAVGEFAELVAEGARSQGADVQTL